MSNQKNTDYHTVVVQRDYRDIITKFEKEFPIELTGKVNQNEFEYTIDKINKWLETAETIDATSIFQECVGCLTFFTFFLCFDDKYKKCVNKIKEFIKEQNETVYNPKGVTFLNPVNNGFIKIEILVHQKESQSISSTSPSIFSSTSQSPSTLIPTNNTINTSNGSSNLAGGSGTILSSSSTNSNIELSPMNNNNFNNNSKSTPTKHHHTKIDIIDDSRVIKKPETIVNVNINNNNIVELSSDEDSDDDSDAFDNDSFN